VDRLQDGERGQPIEIAKLVLNLPKMIVNALIVTLSVALQPVKILKKSP
jgi:hypothetical protein